MTYQQKVLNHLKRYGSITSSKIIFDYNCLRPADVIHKLRKKGHDIATYETGNAKMAKYVYLGEK